VSSAELAPLIQAGGEVDERVVACVEGACAPLKAAGVDTVILGCTHYPLVRPILQRCLGRGVAIVSSGQAIADEVERALGAEGLENDLARRGAYRFLATGDTAEFRRLGTRFLQLPLGEVRHVEVARPRARRRAA
jgi:glutamate racemase